MNAAPNPVRAGQSFYYPRADAAMLENLRQELTTVKFWVVWKEAPPDTPGKKYKKKPLNARTLDGGGWQFPVNWSHHATALKVFEENPTLRGIGPVFSPDDQYCFFDLDGVVKKGKLLDWAAEFVGMVNSYTEISPSGTGIKIIVRAKLGTRRKSFEFKDSKGEPHEIECYDASRFFAATGYGLQGAPSDIENRQELLDTLHPPGTEEEPSGLPIDRATDDYAEDVDAIPDDKVIEKINASGQANKFKRLMEGNTKGYAGRFAASGALCAILAFWTRANPARIDRLYRKSKLFEEEWWSERCYSGRRSRSEYVIDAACKSAAAKDMYVPSSSGLITNDDGKIKPITANAITMLKTTACWDGVIAFNKLTLFTVKLKPAPWEKHVVTQWDDHDDTKLTEWFQRHRMFIDNSKKAGEAAQAVARENSFHPVLDFLNSVKWDGQERLDAWLITYLGAPDTPYIRAVGCCWMISGVARMFRPGCQADYTLLLEGKQGILKSSALSVLASPEFFLDDFSDFENKDTLLKLHGAWIVELGEFSGVRRSAIDKVKAFLTCRNDIFRVPYGRRTQSYPRTNIFAASVNDDTPFTDETGNRRFWPVKCGTINLDKLRSDRDQLWAEAVSRFQKGEHWWLTNELNEVAANEQSERYQEGQVDDIIEKWLENPTQRRECLGEGEYVSITPWYSSHEEVTISDILLHAINKPIAHWTQIDKNSVAKCLKHNHWTRALVRDGEDVRRVYRRPSVTDGGSTVTETVTV